MSAARRLVRALEGCVRDLDPARALAADPVRFARRYRDPRDREAAAFLASALAFGNVKAIGASVAALLDALGPRPAAGAREVARGARAIPEGLYHRWFGAPELHALTAALGRALEGWGSLEACFLAGLGADDADVGPALAAFAERLFGGELSGRTRPSANSRRAPLFPSPAHGSACKRPCLFLRWVARPDDGIDLGLWGSLPPAKLVAPVDVHVARVARRLGVLHRKTIGWAAALEITAALRRVDPRDPLRFDFAMVHVDRERGGRAGDAEPPARGRKPRLELGR
jgi:uncharacterized protein (TIGR02757 family)